MLLNGVEMSIFADKLRDGGKAIRLAAYRGGRMGQVYKEAARLAIKQARDIRLAAQVYRPQYYLLIARQDQRHG